MAQSNFYPGEYVKDICKTCYSTVGDQVSISANQCSPGSNASAYCASCNTKCNTIQTYCNINHQLIKTHGDVGSFSGFPNSDFIHLRWNATDWNNLQKLYEQANEVGKAVSQNGTFSFTRVESQDIITANLYNEFNDAASAFLNGTAIPRVSKDDLIEISHSTALESGFAGSKFNTSVCDICNAQAQWSCSYNCSCNYNCCNYNCSCNYGCSCNYNDTSD